MPFCQLACPFKHVSLPLIRRIIELAFISHLTMREGLLFPSSAHHAKHDHSAASARFANGSYADVARIEGGPAFRQMMRSAVVLPTSAKLDAAQKIDIGNRSSAWNLQMPLVPSAPNESSHYSQVAADQGNTFFTIAINA